ncbi:MAG: peptidase U7 [Gammaproteobacteria bacterium RIFCSPHIGHO2_02_FULL_39_13]|nr:MAG: peptidase U7 [Gammaproteobacteria bacterium RIFCSPHIGHO2_02_FULL_39_13]OGT50573.1 MAG: peptidase U7 [Gammaproteobacteria bacterium RIFCSPHIGHO2_12_FULL_39_24]
MDQTPEKSTLESQLIQSVLSEQKSTRHWKNVRFFVWVILVLFSIFIIIGPDFSTEASNHIKEHKSYVALVRLDGTIMPGNNFSAQKIIPELNRAFKDKNAKGVVLLINSPGGSPVQASLIHDKILQLKEKEHKEVIVVGEDTLASGAYLVSTAADKIFVNKDTVTGSIGVIMEGFGFRDAMQKIGVTRRVFTAGGNKDRLDPFEPLKPEDQAKIKLILDAVHQDFINDVEQGRKGKLNGDPKELFSGDFWTGTQAVQLGLVDATATPWEAMQQTFNTTYYRDYSPRPGFFESIVRDVSTELHLRLMSRAQLREMIE